MHSVCRSLFLAFLLTATIHTGSAAEPQPSETPDDRDDLLEYLTGSYRLIGKELDSDNSFIGHVVITRKEHQLLIQRTIHGVTIQCTGTIETAQFAATKVLRIRFKTAKSNLEGTYLFCSDLDNYARITGYLYKVDPETGRPIETRNPGLETLFPEAPLNR